MNRLPVVYSPEYLAYDFGAGHPFTPTRWRALHDVLAGSDLGIDWIDPVMALDDELMQVHSGDFVSAVKAASDGLTFLHPGFFGLGTGDVPTFLGMHDASAWVVGGTLTAGHLVASGKYPRALQLSGGLHHAMSDRAAGFCVYNDSAVLIQRLKADGLRVAYVDIDVHHGDGVQAIFYRDPDVLTISLHESGEYLFPGTGFVDEIGADMGTGACINIPLHPGTDAESFLSSFDAVVPDSLREFAPDVLVLQSGADAHRIDPLAHLNMTVKGYGQVIDRIISLSEQITDGRIIAVLGGGYAFDSTLRIWLTLAYKLAGQPIPDRLPSQWLDTCRSQLVHPEWQTWLDDDLPREDEAIQFAAEKNVRAVQKLKSLLA